MKKVIKISGIIAQFSILFTINACSNNTNTSHLKSKGTFRFFNSLQCKDSFLTEKDYYVKKSCGEDWEWLMVYNVAGHRLAESYYSKITGCVSEFEVEFDTFKNARFINHDNGEVLFWAEKRMDSIYFDGFPGNVICINSKGDEIMIKIGVYYIPKFTKHEVLLIKSQNFEIIDTLYNDYAFREGVIISDEDTRVSSDDVIVYQLELKSFINDIKIGDVVKYIYTDKINVQCN